MYSYLTIYNVNTLESVIIKIELILLARGYLTSCYYNMKTVKNVFVKVWEGKKFIKNRKLCVGKINSMSPAREKEKILSPLQNSNL